MLFMDMLNFIEPVPCSRPLRLLCTCCCCSFTAFVSFNLEIIPQKTSSRIYLYNIPKMVRLLSNMRVLKFNRYCSPKICVDNEDSYFSLGLPI